MNDISCQPGPCRDQRRGSACTLMDDIFSHICTIGINFEAHLFVSPHRSFTHVIISEMFPARTHFLKVSEKGSAY